MGGGMGGMGGMGAASPAPMASPMASSPMMAAPMGASGVGGATSPPDAKVLASDPLLQVSCVVSNGAPTCSEAHVFLKNVSHATLRNVSVQLEPPPSLRASLQATAPAEARGSRVTLQSLHGGSSTAVGCSMQCVQPLGEAQLLGQVSYVDGSSAEQRVLSFKVPVGLSQLLRPHVITTQQFGGLWPAHAAEKKQVSHAGRFATHPQAFMEMLTATLNLHQVEIIQMECIASGKLVGSETLVLVHAKLGLMAGRALELTVRSKDTRLTESVTRVLAEALR